MARPDSSLDHHPVEHLLDLARAALAAAVEGGPAPEPDCAAHPEMVVPADVFVTLTADGDLRGCMGTLGAEMPAGEAVVRAARMAATGDPRFRPVAADELAGLRVEVSVLTPPHPLADPAGLVPGRDGIVVEARGRRALLLPQVAAEMGWGTAEMLKAACEKAGLCADAWRERGTELFAFEVQRASGPFMPHAVAPPSRAG